MPYGTENMQGNRSLIHHAATRVQLWNTYNLKLACIASARYIPWPLTLPTCILTTTCLEKGTYLSHSSLCVALALHGRPFGGSTTHHLQHWAEVMCPAVSNLPHFLELLCTTKHASTELKFHTTWYHTVSLHAYLKRLVSHAPEVFPFNLPISSGTLKGHIAM